MSFWPLLCCFEKHLFDREAKKKKKKEKKNSYINKSSEC